MYALCVARASLRRFAGLLGCKYITLEFLWRCARQNTPGESEHETPTGKSYRTKSAITKGMFDLLCPIF